MKRFLVVVAVLVLALAAPSLMLAQTGKAEQEVLALQNKINQAVVKADIATLDKSQGDDLIVIGSNGQTTTKAEVLNGVRSGKVKFISEDIVDSKVRLFGNVAVMTATENTVGSYLGNDISGQTRVTYVYVKRGGRWQLVQRQTTRIMQPKS